MKIRVELDCGCPVVMDMDETPNDFLDNVKVDQNAVCGQHGIVTINDIILGDNDE